MRTMHIQRLSWQQSRPFRGTVVLYSREGREFSQICGHLSSVVAPQEMWHETLASALGRELQADGKSGPAANDSVEHKASSGNHALLLSRGEYGASEKLGGGSPWRELTAPCIVFLL